MVITAKIFYAEEEESEDFKKIVQDYFWDMEEELNRIGLDVEKMINKKTSNAYYEKRLNTSFNFLITLYQCDLKIELEDFKKTVMDKIEQLMFNEIQEYMSAEIYKEQIQVLSDEIKLKRVESTFEKKWENVFREAVKFSVEKSIDSIQENEDKWDD